MLKIAFVRLLQASLGGRRTIHTDNDEYQACLRATDSLGSSTVLPLAFGAEIDLHGFHDRATVH